MTSIHVRPAEATDSTAIHAIHRAAFPTDAEARLVALLIERGKATISLVAVVDCQIAGHILFSPATVGPPCQGGPGMQDDSALAAPGPARQAGPTETGLGLAPVAVLPAFQNQGLGLAPVAVLPAWQNQGLGSALVRAGLAECRRLNIPWVVLLGHETYYPRFGFAPASRWNLTGDYGASDTFQFLPLSDSARAISGGHIRYAPEFGEVFSQNA